MAKVFRFTGIQEVESRMQDIIEGDIYRIEGIGGWWKATGDAYFAEATKNWTVNSQPQQLLLENK